MTGAETWIFLNRCASAGIAFSRAQAADSCTLSLLLYPRDIPRAESLALRCGCTLERGRAAGLPALSGKLRRRLVLCIGALIMAAGLLFSSLFVWEISVTENDSELSEREILAALRSDGIGIGSFWPAFREDAIRSRALMRLPELQWVAVNVRGSKAGVEVRAVTPAPEIWDPRVPTDVTAERTGIVDGLCVLEGETLVHRGDVVTEGQTLVSADRPAGAGEGRHVHARAEITAYTWREETAVAPLPVTGKVYSGREIHRFSVVLGNRRINFYTNSGILPAECDKITKMGSFGLEGVFSLPAVWIRETWRPYAEVTEEPDIPALQAALEEELLSRLEKELGHRGRVEELHYSMSCENGRMCVTLRAECLERIDKEVPRE